MTVTLLARTMLTDDAYDLLSADPMTGAADHLAEIAGRECYQSFHRPNPATAHNADYLGDQIIAKQHTSVLAHASFTFRLTDVSRSLTHELIRHRFLAVSELSQRYVDVSESETVVPPLFRDHPGARGHIDDVEELAKQRYNELVALAQRDCGATRKEARQAARYVLPGGFATSMVVSGNVRAWRDFIAQRNSEHADAEIREVARAILDEINKYAPNSVQDLVLAEVPQRVIQGVAA